MGGYEGKKSYWTWISELNVASFKNYFLKTLKHKKTKKMIYLIKSDSLFQTYLSHIIMILCLTH